MEDYFASTRNGHELKDFYDPETNTLDIRSNGLYPSNVLSNLCDNAFIYDGVECGSMEGFLQSLKHQNIEKQKEICAMKGGNARKHSSSAWKKDQMLWWKGQTYPRESYEFTTLVEGAYEAMFEQNERFRTALMKTKGMTLAHTSGNGDQEDTILTFWEFVDILTTLRNFHYPCYLAKELYNRITISELGIGIVNGSTIGRCFGITPLDSSEIVEWRLIIRTDALLYDFEKEIQCLESLSTGLKVESIMPTVKKAEKEIVIIPQPLEPGQNQYVLRTHFCGEFYVRFFVKIEKDSSVEFELDCFDYIDK